MITRENHQETVNKTTNGVYVIGSTNGKTINGMTSAWLTQISFNPLLIAVSIDINHYTCELIKRGNVFSVNVLYDDQKEIAKHFGSKSGKTFNKFSSIDYTFHSTGAPILKDCLGY
ncbi:MAG: flavin reductase family protein, partial [Nitrososphaerota archaeon]